MIYWNVLILSVILFDWCSAETHSVLIILENKLVEHIKVIDLVPQYDDVKVTVVELSYLQQSKLDEICAMERPNLLLDFTTWKIESETMKKMSHFSYIPTITTTFGSEGDFVEWLDLDEKHQKIFLQIKQPADLVPHIVRAIVEHQNYGNAAVLYDKSFVMLHKLKMLLLNLEVRHTILEVHSTTLRQLNDLELFNFFIIGTEETISRVLTNVCENDYFKRNFAWYAITLEEEGNIKVNCSYARYVVASPKATKHLFDINLKDINLPRLTKEFYYDIVEIGINVARSIEKSNLKELCLKEDKDYLVSTSNLVKNAIKDNEKKLINSNYHISTLWSSYAHVEMELHGYLLNENGTQKEHVADWTSENIALLKNIGNMEKYASQIIYRISVAVQEPFLYPDKNSPYNYSGFCIDLIEDIAKKVGFKFELYAPEGSGFRHDFNATIYEVKEGRADIGLGALSVAYQRSSLVDFTIPFYELVGMLIMMKIPESSKSFFKIIEVLDIGVWAVLLLFYFITSFLLWIFDKFSPYSYQNNRELLKDCEETREFTLKECFWFCLTSVTSQGGGEAPRALSGKIVSGVWWFFGFLIVASYTANLAAFLTVSHLESSIESLEDLSKQYKIKYGVINDSNAMRYFEYLSGQESSAMNMWTMKTFANYLTPTTSDTSRYSSDYPIENMYSKMLKFMIDTKAMPNSLEDAIKRVQAATPSENYAYIGDATDIKFAVMTNCDLQIVGEEFAKKFYSLAVKQNSPLKEPLDNALMELLNERKLEKTKNKWWRENPKVAECGNRRFQTDGITIQNVVGVFLLIGGGVVISLIIMGLDNMYEKRMARLTIEVPK